MRRFQALLLLTLGLAACSDETEPVDGGDAGAIEDAGFEDGGPKDAGPEDLGAPDIGDTGDAGSSDTGTAPVGSWRLPEGYFTPARMPMELVHPRPEAPSWAYSRNAYPGIRWEIPLVVQGGAWPFRYQILDAGGADGLVVGGELARSEADGFVHHRLTEDYGVLSWDAPVEGLYPIRLRITDQEGTEVDVDFELRVGTEGWVFVDPATGDDAHDGGRATPLASLRPLYGDDETTSPYVHHRVYLSGVVPMMGNRDNGNLRVASDGASAADLAPRIFVGLPGSGAVLEAFEGRFVIDAPDFYMANLEHRHHEDYAPDTGRYLHMMTVWNRAARFTLHDVAFTRFHGVPRNVDLGNSSIVMFTRGQDRPHVAMVNLSLSGAMGLLSSTYSLRRSVFEKIQVRDAHLDIIDGSAHALIYVKGDNEYVTLRANQFWQDNQWDGPEAAMGILQARNVEFSYNVVHSPIESGRKGALRLWSNSPLSTYSWTVDTPVWLDRNTVSRRIVWEGNRLENMPDDTVRFEANIVEGGGLPDSPRVQSADDLVGEGPFLDAEMKLLDDLRAEHLGRVGAQIAAPLE